ncbi:type II toxin-antitoxin system Phd/YefM family antitoxin [Desertibaculum subflavum]|uniref:type II toxin-antitoxin system Phd/YefM family antitoxin n=1 Tax=Desertibaculum subflavum TaxID=2268458 RepID=UPI000E6690CA
MKSWPVQDAKARFSELLDTCLAEGPQVVTRRGADVAVLVPKGEWARLSRAARPSLKELLLSDAARGDIPVPKRGGLRRRAAPSL